MMGTRAAAFAGKISNLRESNLRIQNGTMPQPTCIDLANMLKYFCQVLHDFRDFKDIENVPLYASEKRDRVQLIKTLPNFDYCGLYRTLSQLVDILPLVSHSSNGYDQLAGNLLMLFKCLLPFLDQANMETMPYLVSTLFMSLPHTFHKDILDTLCFNLLPFTIDQQQKMTARMMKRAAAAQRAKKPRPQVGATAATLPQQRPMHCIVRIENPDGNQDGESIKGDQQDDQQQHQHQDKQEQQQQKEEEGEGDEEEEEEEEPEYALLSVTSILMIAFHYIHEPMHHSQLIECLMKLKTNVFEDLLYVIAYGTSRARCPAVEILFRYWPDIGPTPCSGGGASGGTGGGASLFGGAAGGICGGMAGGGGHKLEHIPWRPTKCQNVNCSTPPGYEDAVKMCLDFKISIALSDLPPPMLVCLNCVDSIYKQQVAAREQASVVVAVGEDISWPPGASDCAASTQALTSSGEHQQRHTHHQLQLPPLDDCSSGGNGSKFIDLLLPMERVSAICENKKCKSRERLAVGTCFDIECANYNDKRPIRYCRQCFRSIHEPCEANGYDLTLQSHIRHSSLDFAIMKSPEQVNNFVEAIISLLREAAPLDRPSKDSERYLRSLMGPASQFSSDHKDANNLATEERQLISQYGIWLMTGLCDNIKELSDELLGRLLGMLFQWFHFTACLPDDKAGNDLERLKGECIKGWIMEVKSQRLQVFIACLLPHPIDCSKIGGHWEVWPDTAHQIKEGFKRLLCLVPYDIITDDVWDEIMPYWMECFRHEVPENELSELKILLSKVFDPELSPLGFNTRQMYNFISSRFEDSNNSNQEQTLYWLQIITMLEITIPIDFLYKMLRSGVRSLAAIRENELARLRIAARLSNLRHSPSGGEVDHPSTGDSGDGRHRRQRRSSVSSSASRDCSATSGSSGESSKNSDDDDDEQPISVAEDDVLLPVEEKVQTRPQPLTEQERRAQARAAFSAKILEHASMLSAQEAIDKQALGDGGASVATTVAINQQQLPSASATASLRAEGPQVAAVPKTSTASSGEPRLSSSTARPAERKHGSKKSSSISNGKPRRHHHEKRTHKEAANNKRKLKLNLESTMDELGTNNPVDNNLICYILMLDILLKQLDLQEINSRRGLDSCEAQQAIELLNSIISTPWIGKHTCCDSLPHVSSGSPPPPTTTIFSSQAGQSTSNMMATSFSTSSSSNKQNLADLTSLAMAAARQQAAAQQARNEDPFANFTNGSSHNSLSAAAAAATSTVHSFGHCAQGFEYEDSHETCVFCEIISTFQQLAMSLIEFFSTLIETSICDVSQDAANGEFDGKPDYSRIGLDHLGPSNKQAGGGGGGGGGGGITSNANVDMGVSTSSFDGANNFIFGESRSAHAQAQQQREGPAPAAAAARPSSPFPSPSYLGPTLRVEVLNSLPQELQLAYNLLVQFHHYQTPDIVSQLLQMIKLISLNNQVLSKAAKSHPQFISWCQHNMLVNKLWSLCQLESSEIARTCVPLLLHCVTLPWGVRLFRDLIERDFNSENWLARFRAVERVVTIAYFCEPNTIKSSTLLQSTMASAFCYVVRCLDDIEAIVAQRALVALEMMKTSSLKLLLWCLEAQFDCIIADRPMILRSVFQLYNHLRDRRFLTWDFFLNRFDTIFLEAQIYLQQTGEIPSFTMQDLKNTNTKSEIYQKKISRAKEALAGTHHSRSLSVRFNEKRQQRQRHLPTAGGGGGSTSSTNSVGLHQLNIDSAKQSLRLQQQIDSSEEHRGLGSLAEQQQQQLSSAQRGAAATTLMRGRRALEHGQSTFSRYQAVALLTSQALASRKNSKFMSNLAMQSVPPLLSSLPDKLHQHLPNSFVDDGSKLNEIAQENHVFGVVHRLANEEDRDTNHCLISLLMQFYSKPDGSHPQSLKTLTRSHQIVLRHLNILMGFSVARKNFLLSAANLRLLPVFNGFLTALPKVLDFNYTLGTILLDTCLPLLIYCPAPGELHYDTIRAPTYSLWLLNPLLRQSWLMSVMTFLYKYQFSQPHLKDSVHRLMWIVINTLESHLTCAASPDLFARAFSKPAPVERLTTVRTNTHLVDSSSASSTPNVVAATAATTSHQVVAGRASSPPDGATSSGNHTAPVLDSSSSELPTSSRVESPRSQQVALGSSQPEMIELRERVQQQATASASVTPHLSGSCSQQLSSVSGAGQQVATTGTSAASITMMKAETSDNLSAKSKLFQRSSKQVASIGGARELMPKEELSSVACEERLLPFGPAQPGSTHHRVRRLFADNGGAAPQEERLLPIGASATQSGAPVGPSGLSKQQVVAVSGEQRIVGGTRSQVDAPQSRTSPGKSHVFGSRAASETVPTPGNVTSSGGSTAKQSPGLRTNFSSQASLAQQHQQVAVAEGAHHSTPATPPAHAPQSKSSALSVLKLMGKSDTSASGGSGGGEHQETPITSGKMRRFGSALVQKPEFSSLENTSGPSSSAAVGAASSVPLPPQLGVTSIGGSGVGKFVKSSRSQIAGASGIGGREHASHKQVSTASTSFSSPSLLNEQLAQLNRHSMVQEFSDKDLSMCLVILETFIHHEPSMAAPMLPNILRLVARYSSSTMDAWQTGSSVHLVGGSVFVARQFIRVALHDLMENNIFHQIFTSNFTGYEFYKSMATALADFTDLNQLAPLSKLFEDLARQKNLPPASSLMTILENVATYFECIISESSSAGGSTGHSLATWSQFITNWENFLRKLILALPRYSGIASVSPAAAAAAAAASATSPTTGTTTSTGGTGGGGAIAGGVGSSSASGVAGVDQTSPQVGGSPATLGQATSGSAVGSVAAIAGQGQAMAAGSSAVGVPPGTGAGGGQGAGGEQGNNGAAAAVSGGGGGGGAAIPSSCSMIMAPIMRIILATTKIPHLAASKTIVDPYSKIISYTVLNSQFKYEHLLEINHNCCRLYTRDREKYLIQRTIAYELVQVLKFRFFILEENLLILLLFVLQDVGGTLAPKVMRDSLGLDRSVLNQADSYITNVSECLRQHIGDLLEFITDVHAISRINDNLIGTQHHHQQQHQRHQRSLSINRDSFGGHVKAAISQYLALEIALSNSGGDSRTILRYFPWLYTAPSLQQGPREFIDCVSHIRQLSWIILGSLQHSALLRANFVSASAQQGCGGGSSAAIISSNTNATSSCQPIPIEKNSNVAEHVQVILAGFAEQSKESVLHMSGLFHAFLLCQLWTMYCESLCAQHAPHSEQYQFCQSTLDDFWAKITPGVLRLVGHSRVMSEMVSTHFLQLIESLIESNSSILIRYLPMWNSVFYSYRRRNKSGNLAIRLQKCIEWQPPDFNEPDAEQGKRRFVNWLEKVQYKMSHIEIQSSQAAPFYLS